MAEGSQHLFVADEIQGGGGGGSDGRVDTAMSSSGGGGAPHDALPSNGSVQLADTPALTLATDTNNMPRHHKKEPVQRGFHQSSLVFEYGPSEDQYLTTSRQGYQHHRPLPHGDPSTTDPDHLTTTTLTTSEYYGSDAYAIDTSRAGVLPTIDEGAMLASTGPAGAQHTPTTTLKQPQHAGPNELFFGTDRSSGVSHRDKEERLRLLRERQQTERQQKLEELKEHAAAAQRFREQQEAQRRQRLQELRSRDHDRRSQVEERRRYMEQAEQQRREAAARKSVERDQRLETKRRNERSNIVFAFGSSTPRMLDPKETIAYWASRRAASISNVTMGSDISCNAVGNRRSSECVDGGAQGGMTPAAPELARKRAASAQGLDRNDLRMSSSMYEVFHWTDSSSTGYSTQSPQVGEDGLGRTPGSSVARRRTDLHPITPSLRDAGKPRHRSPGRAISMSRLDQLAKPRQYPLLMTPLHEKNSGLSPQRMSPSPHSRTRSMTHLAGRSPAAAARGGDGVGAAKALNRPLSRSSAALIRSTRAEQLRQLARQNAGVRSGGVTPTTTATNPSSRPTSALSHASSSGVTLRQRPATATRKPRPMSIAGSAPSGADRPRSPASRDGRTALRNTSSGSISSVKSTRAKSAGGSDTNDVAAPVAPPRTPKRTPHQVKAESAAKRAEKAKAPAAPVSASTAVAVPATKRPKTTANIKPAVPTRKVPKKPVTSGKEIDDTKAQEDKQNGPVEGNELTVTAESAETAEEQTVVSTIVTTTETVTENGVETTTTVTETKNDILKQDSLEAAEQQTLVEAVTVQHITADGFTEPKAVAEAVAASTEQGGNVQQEGQQPPGASTEEPTVEVAPDTDGTDTDVCPPAVYVTAAAADVADTTGDVASALTIDVSAASVAGDASSPVPATEAVLVTAPADDIAVSVATDESSGASGTAASGDRPAAGYTSEEEYKAVLAEKRRLAREAKERELEMERQRQEEEAERERREEEELLRLMEEQKAAEEERLRRAIEQADREREEEQKRKEEEEHQRLETERLEAERQREAEEKLRKEEEERLLRKNRVAAIMARTRSKGGGSTPNRAESKTPSDEHKNITDVLQQANLTDSMIDKMSDSMIAMATTGVDSEAESCHASSGVPSEPMSDFSSQPSSDVSGPQQPRSDVSSQSTLELHSDCQTSGASSMEQTVRCDDTKHFEELNTGVVQVIEEERTYGNGAVPMDTTPVHHMDMDLLGSLNGHTNGVDNSNSQHQKSIDLLGSFDPYTSSNAHVQDLSSTLFATTNTEFEQIIDASQTKLCNEDAINSNPPPAPFIGFEENLNKKTTPENNTSVPDILL